jgi:hypothetical protein
MSIQDRQLASAVDEYADVLQRPENRLATGLSEADVEGFLAAFASAAEGVDVNFRWRPRLPPCRSVVKLRVMLPRELLKELEL